MAKVPNSSRNCWWTVIGERVQGEAVKAKGMQWDKKVPIRLGPRLLLYIWDPRKKNCHQILIGNTEKRPERQEKKGRERSAITKPILTVW